MSTDAPATAAPHTGLHLPQNRDEFQQLIDRLFQRSPSTASNAQALDPAAEYGRLSKVDPHQTQYSFDIQQRRMDDFAREHGLEIVARYTDPDATGRHSRRKGWRKMIRDLKAGRFRVVLFHRIDRAFRNVSSFAQFLDLANRYHVRVMFVDEPFDTESPAGRMVMLIVAILAEFFLRLTSQRVREMKEVRYQHGLPNGAARFGYCNGLCSKCTDPNGPGYCPLVGHADRGDGRVLVPHPIESHALRLVCALYQQGWSGQEIADYLNTRRFGLPDGSIVQFRTKGTVGRYLPGLFTESSIRLYILSPFPAGYVARYPSPPLDMTDNPEYPDRKPARPPQPVVHRRIPLQLIKGQHVAIIPFEMWQQNQLLRSRKQRTPTTLAKPKEGAMFTGVARCWVCYDFDGKLVNLRGSTGSTDHRGYARCGRLQDCARVRRKQPTPAADESLSTMQLTAEVIPEALTRRKHHVPQEHVIAGLTTLVNRLIIPAEWYDTIIAYVLTDDGLVEFKRQSQELRQQLERVRHWQAEQLINRAEVLHRISQINHELRRLQPTAHPFAAQILPLLKDFPALWSQLTTVEQRSLLQAMFTDVFFDPTGEPRSILANSPFEALLKITADGQLASDA